MGFKPAPPMGRGNSKSIPKGHASMVLNVRINFSKQARKLPYPVPRERQALWGKSQVQLHVDSRAEKFIVFLHFSSEVR